MCERFIGLTRCSSEQQGQSGLGLSAGRYDLDQYVAQHGGEIIQVLTEVESGMHDDMMDRPTLLKAIALCKRHRAALLVANVDRLSRSTCVHADIRRSKIKVRFADDPTADQFVVDIKVAVAAKAGRDISKNTSRSLQTYKREKRVSKRLMEILNERHQGNIPQEAIDAVAGKLGAHLVGSHLTKKGRTKGRIKANLNQRKEAVDAYSDLTPDIVTWKNEGHSLRAIAEKLNERGETTRNGSKFTQVQVKQILNRAGISTSR